MRTFRHMALSAVLSASLSTGAASMNSQTLLGTIDDPRIKACGIHVQGTDWVEFLPFIQTAADFNGSFEIGVTKTSRSGTSQTRQANRIQAGVFDGTQIRLDRPASVALQMKVMDETGKVVCHLAETIELDAAISL